MTVLIWASLTNIKECCSVRHQPSIFAPTTAHISLISNHTRTLSLLSPINNKMQFSTVLVLAFTAIAAATPMSHADSETRAAVCVSATS